MTSGVFRASEVELHFERPQKSDDKIMYNFTAVIEKDGDWYIAYCPEVSGANGQGKTIEECKKNLAEAILLIFEDRHKN